MDMGFSGLVAATAPLDGVCVVTIRTSYRTVGNGSVARGEEDGVRSLPFPVYHLSLIHI